MTTALPDPSSLQLYRPEPVPVAVVTGFLGSGKTTFIRRLLTERGLRDTAVLVSEFGEIGLDHLLVEALSENVMLLEGGCLCCAHGGDLAEALRLLLERRERGEVPHYRRVILETSGLADPGPILQSFMVDPLNLSIYRLATVVAVVDSLQGLATISSYPESQRQLAMADAAFLSKLDVAAPGQALQAAMMQQMHGPIWHRFADVPDAMLFVRQDGGAARNVRSEPDIGATHHRSRFATCSRRIDQELDRIQVEKWLYRLLDRGKPILRMKAVLPLAGEERPAVLHAVGHRAERMAYLPRWPSGNRTGVVTLIGERCQAETLRSLVEELLDSPANAGTSPASNARLPR
jgi:G3E family GTPase